MNQVEQEDLSRPGHEGGDVRVQSIALFGGGLAALIVFALALSYGVLATLAERRSAVDIMPSPLAARQAPPEPLLQVTPAQDLAKLRAAEEEILRSYGWVDRDAGAVRIPIDRAMDLVLERGLPARAEKPAARGETER